MYWLLRTIIEYPIIEVLNPLKSSIHTHSKVKTKLRINYPLMCFPVWTKDEVIPLLYE